MCTTRGWPARLCTTTQDTSCSMVYKRRFATWFYITADYIADLELQWLACRQRGHAWCGNCVITRLLLHIIIHHRAQSMSPIPADNAGVFILYIHTCVICGYYYDDVQANNVAPAAISLQFMANTSHTTHNSYWSGITQKRKKKKDPCAVLNDAR